jgi:hypothetical protein
MFFYHRLLQVNVETYYGTGGNPLKHEQGAEFSGRKSRESLFQVLGQPSENS